MPRNLASPRLSVPVLAALTAVVVAACGSSAGANTTQQPAQGGGSSSANSNPGGSADSSGRGPAASGKIAAITGHTMQVQSQQSGQVAVSWKSSTTFSHTITTKVSTIKKGDCVIAVAKSGSGTDQSSKITAGTLTVTKPVHGACTMGVGANGSGRLPSGGFPSRGNFPSSGNVPSGRFPSGAAPSGFAGGTSRSGAPGAGFGGFAAGQVQAVTGDTLTITNQQPGSSTKTTRTVVVDSSTTVRTQASTTAKSLHVGKCVVAVGKTDKSGSVAARTVQIDDPTNGQCGGFGAFGGGNG